MENRLRYFLGKPARINHVNIYSPTIDSIAEIGELTYKLYVIVASFDKEVIFKNLFNLSDDEYSKIENEDTYDLLVSVPAIKEEMLKAYNFFTKENVKFDNNLFSFMINDKVFINKENYIEVSNIIKEINGILEEDNKLKFVNEKAKQMYEKLQRLKNKYKKNKDDSLDLKDILSILCSAEGNGINVFNVGNLTIYQVYEHFERLNIKERHARLLRVWANGFLGENEKLPEWITKSKF